MDSIFAPLLDTEETTDPGTPKIDFQTFSKHSVISEWTAAEQLYATLAELDYEDNLETFLSCRQKAWFVQNSETLEIRVASKHCNLRWCPLCANSRQAFITDQTQSWLKTCQHPKLLTLTLRHTTAPLDTQIDFLYECFRQLRKRAYFKNNVCGGIWFFQVKTSKTDESWHPHLHCTIDGSYLKFNQIKTMWAEITRGSQSVNIKVCTDIERSAKHIARYAARPVDLNDLKFSSQLEVYLALKSRRLVGSWGSARPMSFRPSKPDDAEQWHDIGSWYMITMNRKYSDDAAEIWKAFITNQPAARSITMKPLENLMAGIEPAASPVPVVQEYLDFYNRGG